ncbi:hypothetical protein SDC9_206687 [bioreactor metagenome]|uniref:Uncharacterized protein n=1 Tax=bioreactor metagenome TaxID=1076179 RepID=A0A645J755_9ZZZZ
MNTSELALSRWLRMTKLLPVQVRHQHIPRCGIGKIDCIANHMKIAARINVPRIKSKTVCESSHGVSRIQPMLPLIVDEDGSIRINSQIV